MTLISLANRFCGRACFAPADQTGSSGTRVPVEDNQLFEKTGDCHAGDHDLFVFRPRPRRNPTVKRASSPPASTKAVVTPGIAETRANTQAASRSTAVAEKPVVQATPPRPLTPPAPEPVPVSSHGRPEPVEPAHVAAANQRRATQPPQARLVREIAADEPPLFGGITDPDWRPDNHLGGSLLED